MTFIGNILSAQIGIPDDGDECPPGTMLYYRDSDGDGYGNPDIYICYAQQQPGYVLNYTDCNDNDATIYPGAPELLDGKDNDCDGLVDEAAPTYLSNTNFESGLGDWLQDPNDDINWTRQSGSTPSSNTGPSSAVQGSYYVYLEATSNLNKRGILRSPFYIIPQGYELRFNYHMYGTTIANLKVEISSNGSSWTQLWSKSGDQGNNWQEAVIDLSSYGGNTRYIRFNGLTGSSYTSDIAIDNIIFKSSSSSGGGGGGAFSDENYVYTRTYRQPYSTSLSQSQVTPAKATESITYFDGLGRPMQQIGIKQSDGANDIITHIGYDGYGRQDKQYLPYASSGGTAGSYRSSGVLVDLENYYYSLYGEDFNGMSNNTSQVDGLPVYSEKHLESSPLSRVLEQGAPGKSWRVNKTSDSDHTIKFDYQANTSSDHVKLYRVDLSGGTPELTGNGDYPAGRLYKTVTKDENWSSGKLHTTEEFKDKQGRVVLKRTYGPADKNKDGNIGSGESIVAHDTYYVYDDYGNLSFVLPPLAAGLSLNALLASSSGGSTSGTGPVYSQAVVGNGESLALTSSDVIVLQPGFHAQSGSNFRASIDEASTGGSDNSLLSELCYQYRYDHRNRLIEKKIPGKGWEYIVYNKLDQPILTQDALQAGKSTKEWLFTKYDAFGRVVYTGLYKSNLSRSDHQDNADAENDQYEKTSNTALNYGGGTFYYTDDAYPDLSSHSSNVTLYTVNYYDDYRFYGSNLPQSVYSVPVENYNNASNTRKNTKGLTTGSRVRVLTTNSWITTVMGYDKKGRVIYSKTENPYLQTSDVIKSKLDFLGQMDESTTVHTKTNQPSITTVDKFEYDDLGRLTKQTQKINSQAEELIAFNEYDELGQLKRKKVGNTQANPLQNIDYTYNVRGWLKKINDPASLGDKLFAFKLNYNTTEMGINGIDSLFNGNISETIWRTANTETYGNRKRGYAYQYDALNRIKSGAFRRGTSNGSSFTEQASNYNLTGMVYDLNGNIRKLKRYGPISINSQGGVANYGVMDDLTYSYDMGNSSNRLTQVSDAGNKDYGFKDGATSSTEFGYDVNGNMIKDLNKGIGSIAYNHLNLPEAVNVTSNKGDGTGTISYIYDATGVKLKKTAPGNVVTEYAGNYVYKKVNNTTTLEFFNHAEGYVEKANNAYKYVYQYKDHLGNIRVSYDNNGSVSSPNASIVEEKNYYPFGLEHSGYNSNINGVENNYQTYNGKELNKELGLDWHDFGARNYDAALGRWMNLDPLAEDMRRHSPYNYAFDNPVYYIDPDGMAPFGEGGMDEEENFDNINNHIASTVVDDTGRVIDYEDDGDSNIYLNERSEENIIGTERKGVDYSNLDYLSPSDINPGADLPLGFIMVSGNLIFEKGEGHYLGSSGGLEWIAGAGPWKIRNIGSFYVRLKTLLSGGAYKVGIQTLVGLEEVGNLPKLLKTFEAEAKAAGATKIVIEGVEIVNPKITEKIKLAERLGYKIEKITNTTVKIVKDL